MLLERNLTQVGTIWKLLQHAPRHFLPMRSKATSFCGLFIKLCTMVLTFESLYGGQKCNHQIKANGQHFHSVLFATLYRFSLAVEAC